MKIRLFQCEDEDEAKMLHALAFKRCVWTTDEDIKDGQHWIARDELWQIVGFCSAKYVEDKKLVRLARAAVAKTARGQGLQCRMIRVRCQWGKRMGATRASTYCSKDNYESIHNLIKCGFRFYKPKDPAWGEWHNFEKDL